jgi:hypothetical protein
MVNNGGLNSFDPIGLCVATDITSLQDHVKKRMCCAYKTTVKDSKGRERGGAAYKPEKKRFKKKARQWSRVGPKLGPDTMFGRGYVVLNYPPSMGFKFLDIKSAEQKLDLVWHTHPLNSGKDGSKEDKELARTHPEGVKDLILTRDGLFCFDVTKDDYVNLGSLDSVLDCSKACCKGYEETTTGNDNMFSVEKPSL